MKVSIVVVDEFTDIDVFLMWDLLSRVSHPQWEVKLIGEQEQHRSRTGIPIPMHGSITQANVSDAVLFTSGPGTRAKMADASFLAQLKLEPERQLIGSICAGALILAALGLLTGKRATTHPTVKSILQTFPVEVVDEPFVRVGNIATAGGCLAAQHLVSWVIETLVGESARATVLASIQPVGQAFSLPEPSGKSPRDPELADTLVV